MSEKKVALTDFSSYLYHLFTLLIYKFCFNVKSNGEDPIMKQSGKQYYSRSKSDLKKGNRILFFSYGHLCMCTYIQQQYEAMLWQNFSGSRMGFIYTFWYSLLSTSSILVCSSFAKDYSSEGFQHHFKICLLWLLHEKECSF